MIRNVCMLFILCFPLYGEKVGSLFLGTSSIGGAETFYPRAYDVKNGVSAGLLIPIRFPHVDVHYKVRASQHPALSDKSYDDRKYEYLAASNVLLVGKWFNLGPVTLLPQGGLGLLYEVIHHEWDYGHMYNLLFVDYSVKLNVPSIQARWGVLFNLEHGIAASNPGYSPDNRFHFSVVYTY